MTDANDGLSIVFLAWLGSIFWWLVSWRQTLTDRKQRVIPSIFLSLMIAIVVSCLTQESLAPSHAMVPFLLHFYLVLGIWMSYYRHEMMQRTSESEGFSPSFVKD